MTTLASAALILIGYAAGALPWGVLLGKMFRSTDLREHGSGGTGTTNAYRILGWRISIAVLVLDFVKGLGPVVLARALDAPAWTTAAVAVATVAGHCWSPAIQFEGGKGVATGAGAASGLTPAVLLVLPVMLLEVIRWRYVSLASLTGAGLASLGALLAAMTGFLEWPFALSIVAMSAIIVFQHRTNIGRLLQGTERKLAWPPSSAGNAGPRENSPNGPGL